MQKVKTIIFDLGGVLIDWNPVKPYIEIFKGDTEKAKWFIENVCNQEWNAKQDEGRSFEDAAIERIIEFPEYEVEIKSYFDLWEEMLEGEISGTVNILKALHLTGLYKLLVISNWSAETFPIAYQKYDFLKMFSDLAISGELKMIKPNPEIFEYMMTKHKLNPESTVFIDDNEDNIKASTKLGLQSILFTNPDQLYQSLEELGVKI